MRILLVSDTHGKLDCLNTLAEKTKADLIIHAGDFGFYSEDSLKHLGQRELKLLITHSPFRDQITQNSKEKMENLIREERLLGDFPDYLEGKKQFSVPVYVVWGNHEDHEVLKELRAGRKIPNLHILDEHNQYTLSNAQGYPFFSYGLGGNFVLNEKVFEKEFQGGNGKVYTTFHQLGTLFNKVKDSKIPSIFVSHVSPGKEPLLSRLLSYKHPNFWISGHMGLSYPCVWNQFAIRDKNDVEHWMSDLDFLKGNRELSQEAASICKLLQKPLGNPSNWFYKTWNVNLPDVGDGHALLTFQDNTFALETFGGCLRH